MPVSSSSVVKQEAVSSCDESLPQMKKIEPSMPDSIKQEVKKEDPDDSISTTDEQRCLVPNSTLKEEDNDMKPPSSVNSTSTTSTSSLSRPALAPRPKKVFKPDELRQALMPTLEKLYRQDPESLPFRQPVDPTLLQIPDYFDIIKKPMDLSTIKRKLDTGQYHDPWEYVEDVWLMFDNAWLYNKKTSRVYRYCTKVSF